MNYTGKARAFYDKIHTLRAYNYNTLYRAEDGTIYYINRRGYMHIFTARKTHFDGRELYLITDRLLTEAGTLKESNTRMYNRQQAMELVEEMQTAADKNTKAARLDMINLGYIEAVEAPQTAKTAAIDETPTSAKTSQQEGTQEATEAHASLYKYGMRLRGYSIGAQPTGVVSREDDQTGTYYDIITYNRPLTAEEIKHYSLTPLECPTAAETATSEGTPTGTTEGPTAATGSQKKTADDTGSTPAGKATQGAAEAPETVTQMTNTTPPHKRPPRGKTRAGPARPAAKEGSKKLDFGIYEKISQKYQVQKSSTLFNH